MTAAGNAEVMLWVSHIIVADKRCRHGGSTGETMNQITRTVAAVCLTAVSGAAMAADYEQAVANAVADYAAPGSFAGVSINIACRHLPAMDFIASHKEIFEKATGAKIKFTNYPIDNDLRTKIVADASTKAGNFQLYCLDNNYIPLFASSKWVTELDGAIKPAYKLDDVFGSLKNSYSWQDKLYGLPIYAEVTILYYRKDLFNDAGLKAPATLDELEADAAKLNAPPQTFGISLRGLHGEGMNVYTWTEWMRSYGADFLDDKMNPIFNSPAAIEGTEHYASLLAKYAAPGNSTWGWDKVSSAFAQGHAAMIVESTAFYPVFNDPKQSSVAGKVGYAVVPAGPKGAYPANYSIGMAIPSTVDPSSKTFQAVTAFLQWSTSQEMELARTDKDIGNEDRKSVNQSDLLKSKYDPGYVAAVSQSQAITQTHYRPMIPQWRQMGDIIGMQIESAFTGAKSAKDALDEAAKETAARFKDQGLTGVARSYAEVFPGN
jgi:multiple sugar transport system substrate-binding protein